MTRFVLIVVSLTACSGTEKYGSDTGYTYEDIEEAPEGSANRPDEPSDEDDESTDSGVHEDTAEEVEPEPEPEPEGCPEGYTCEVVPALVYTTPTDATQMNHWFMTSCNIVWNGETDVIEGPCEDLEFFVAELPGVTDFSTIPDWSLEVALAGCYDQVEDCASGFYGPEEAFSLAADGSGMFYSVEAGNYGAPFSCDIYDECDNPAEGGQSYTWSGTICRTDKNPDSLADVRSGVDYFEYRNGEYLGGDRGDWTPLVANQCVMYR